MEVLVWLHMGRWEVVERVEAELARASGPGAGGWEGEVVERQVGSSSVGLLSVRIAISIKVRCCSC